MPAPAVRRRSARSCRRTCQPRRASAHAAASPAKPPPTISALRAMCRRIPSTMSLDQRIDRFPRRKSKNISYRETGAGQALVLLHGIGSSSAGWLVQLETLAGYRLIAWDAPGYGESDFLTSEKPKAADYAQALHE